MADARSTIHWLKKGLPKLEQAFRGVEHYSPSSTKRKSAERKWQECIERIRHLEDIVAQDEISNPTSTSSIHTDASQESELTDQEGSGVVPSDMDLVAMSANENSAPITGPAAMNAPENPEDVSPADENPTPVIGSAAMNASENPEDVSPADENSTPATDYAAVNASENPEGVSPSDRDLTPKAVDVSEQEVYANNDHIDSVDPSLIAPEKLSITDGPTAEQLAEIAEMYPVEPTNDYDIDELVERFTDDDTVYAGYAAKFAAYPEFDNDSITFKVVHAFPSFAEISVKTVSAAANRWDNLCGSDKVCLSILGRVAIRRFVDAYKTDPNATLSPNWVKVLARIEPRFLPEAATTSAPVALAFLRMQNLPELRCRFHHNERHDKRSTPDTLKKFTGCAFPPPETGEKKPRGKPKGKAAIPDAPTRKEGHLDCGCAVLDALEDWFHYKTARLFSTNPRIQQAFPIQGVISTAERASLLNALRCPIYIPLRLRYTGVNGWPDLAGQWMRPSYELDLLRKCSALIATRIRCLEMSPAPTGPWVGVETADAQYGQLENPEKAAQASGNVQPEEEDGLPVAVKRVLDGGDTGGQAKKSKVE